MAKGHEEVERGVPLSRTSQQKIFDNLFVMLRRFVSVGAFLVILRCKSPEIMGHT